MSSIVPHVPADLAGSREEADLVEKLVASGAIITETERKQLLDQFLAEHQADRESGALRARFAPTTDLHIGEDTMNANDIVTQIEQTRSVISAQIRKLNELTYAPFLMPAAEADGTSGLADPLHATVAAHITNAADTLRAIAEIEAAIRAPACNSAVSEPRSAPGSPQIIDAEIREVV